MYIYIIIRRKKYYVTFVQNCVIARNRELKNLPLIVLSNEIYLKTSRWRDGTSRTVQIARNVNALRSPKGDTNKERRDGRSRRKRKETPLYPGGSLMSDVYFMVTAWLWQHRVGTEGPRDVINEVVPHIRSPYIPHRLTWAPLCLFPLHHIIHKRLQSLDYMQPLVSR